MYLWRFRDSGNIKKNFTLPWSQNWIWHIIPCSIQAEYAKPNVTSYDASPCGKKCGPNRGSSKKSQKEVKVSSSNWNGPKNVGHNLIGTNIAHCKSHIWQEVVLICLCMFIVHMLHQIRVLKRLCWDSTPHMSLLAETNSIGVLNGKA